MWQESKRKKQEGEAEAEAKAQNAFPNDVFEKQCKCFLRHLPVQKAHKKTQNKTKQKPKCRTATALPPTLLTHLTHSYPTTFAFLLFFSCLQRCNVSETATELPNACMQNERSSIVQKGGGEEEEEEEAVAGGFGVTTNTRQAAPQCMRKAMKKTCSKIVHSPKK